MKKTLMVICFLALSLSIVFSGCTQEESSMNTTESNENSSNESIENNTIPEPETIETILNKPESIDSIYYEITMNMEIDMDLFGFEEQSALMKIWQKENYSKWEITSEAGGMSTSILLIQRPDGTYIYNAEKDEYTLSTDEVNSITSSLKYFDNDMVLEYISNLPSSNFETELIDGKEATIIEYSPNGENSTIYVKLLIWNEKGVPLKGIINMIMEEMNMNMEFTFDNYSFSEIPDNIFNLN